MPKLPHLKLSWICPDCGQTLEVEGTLYHHRYDKDELYKELHHLIGDHLHLNIVETFGIIEVDRKAMLGNFHKLSLEQRTGLIGYYKSKAIKGDER